MRSLLIAFVLGFVISAPSCSQSQPNLQSSKVPLEVKIGQMLTVGFRGMTVADTNHIARDIQKYHLGGVVLFDYDVPRGEAKRNIRSPEQLKSLVTQLQELAELPLFVTIDQEGGKVTRLKPKYGFPETVSAQYLGQLNNPDSTRHYARQIAQSLSRMGINMDLAPVVDVNTNPDNPVIGSLDRSFSSDPAIVAEQAALFIKTLHQYNILSVIKHFPGHGSSKSDSHLGLVDVTDSWSERELTPYKQLIDSHLVDAIMTAHIFNARLDSTYPATLSRPTISGLLRKDLGFEGVVISDDMMMGAIRKEYGLKTAIYRAIDADVDILVFGNNSIYDPEIVPKAHRIIKELLQEGRITREQINRSYERIMALKQKLAK